MAKLKNISILLNKINFFKLKFVKKYFFVLQNKYLDKNLKFYLKKKNWPSNNLEKRSTNKK